MMRKDITNKTFGKLTAITYEKRGKATYWKCLCECGKITYVRLSHLTGGTIQSCGCSKTIKNLSGQVFGNLTVTDEYEQRKQPIEQRNRTYWKCICECGKDEWIRGDYLSNGKSICTSCAKSNSHKIEYGMSSKKRLFRRYKNDAKRKKRNFLLEFEEFMDITSSNCFYCGCKPSTIQKADGNNGDYLYNGIDRIDSSLHYSQDNIVPCCVDCNFFKGIMSTDEFIVHVNKIQIHQLRKSIHKKKYCMYIGRWQPCHKGHLTIINQNLSQGNPVLIMVRDIPPDEGNPFTTEQTVSLLTKVFQNYDVQIMIIPDIKSVNYGRGVGYAVTEITVPPNTARISATEIRNSIRSNDNSWKEFVPEVIHNDVVKYLNAYEESK